MLFLPQLVMQLLHQLVMLLNAPLPTMCFNSCKVERIRYTFSNGLVINYAFLSIDGSEIIEKQHLRDLGVTMSNNAAFQDYTSNIARSSRMKLGWILRTFQTRDRQAILTLWKTLVIPILDYCCQL